MAAVNAFGGRYSKDLTRECTHLISAKSTSQSKSSEKVQWAVKELKDRSTKRRRGHKLEGDDMRIVYEEWLWDCVGLHGRFSEDDYDAIRRPRPVGKVKAEEVLDGTVQQRQAEEEEQKAAKKEDPGAGAGEDDGPAVMRKRKRNDLVGELISTTGPAVGIKSEVPDGLANRIANDGAQEEAEAGPSRPRPPPPPSSRPSHSSELRKASLLHATRTASFGPTGKPTTSELMQLDGLGSTPSMPPSMPQSTTAEMLSPRPAIPQIFAGLRFSHLIDEGYEGLERALVAHGGEVVSEQQRLAGEHVDRVIVRL